MQPYRSLDVLPSTILHLHSLRLCLLRLRGILIIEYIMPYAMLSMVFVRLFSWQLCSQQLKQARASMIALSLAHSMELFGPLLPLAIFLYMQKMDHHMELYVLVFCPPILRSILPHDRRVIFRMLKQCEQVYHCQLTIVLLIIFYFCQLNLPIYTYSQHVHLGPFLSMVLYRKHV